MNDTAEATKGASPRAGSPRRVLLGAFAALTAVGAFITTAALVARSNTPSTPPRAELGLVLRTAQHLRRAGDVTPVVERLAARGAKRAWVQVKQDETDEVPSGTLYAPSRLAPVAPGFADDRLGTFVNELSARGIAPMAWMPVLQDSRAAAAHPDWASRRIEADGTLSVEEGWLCPFNPGVARYEAQVAREIVARYPKLQGLYLDFIRYDDDYSCAGPEALRLLDARTKWSARTGRPLTLMDIRRAGESQGPLWEAWTGLRAEKLVETVNTIRDAVEEVRPDFRIGAFVLPFTAEDYADNTQSGQDLERLARAGLDEIVLMGYWDDWDRDPAWARRGLDSAATLVEDEADLSVVLDGDMGIRRTRLTLDALGPWSAHVSWFNFDEWTPSELSRLARAIDGHAQGPVPAPERVSVVVRIDTEPDADGRYETVAPRMIDTLVSALDDEDVPATFVTVGRLAQQQPGALRRAAAAGHEIASHSGDHEQIDSLPLAGQLASVDRGLSRLKDLGFDVRGFGAPRNSITNESRDRLMDWDLEYDGSASYDPGTSLLDVHYARRSDGGDSRIVVVPYIQPNDWDARYIDEMSADEMAATWIAQLERVVALGEPVFVLDVHQWIISQPDNLAALRTFLRAAKACDRCRVETLRSAALNARATLDRYEIPATTSGAVTAGRPLASGRLP